MAAGPTGDTIAPTSGVTGKELDQFLPSSGVAGALRLLASVIIVPGGVSIKGGRLESDRRPDGRGQPDRSRPPACRR